MDTQPRLAQSAGESMRLNQEEISLYVVRRIAALGIGAALLAWWTLLPSAAPESAVFVWVPLIAVIWLCAYLASTQRPRLSAHLTVLGAVAAVIIPAVVYGIGEATCGFVIAVLVAGSLYGPWVGVGVALALAAITPSLSAAHPWRLPVILILSTGACQWVILRPLASLLERSWQRSARATELAEALRDHQGELNRALTALDLTNRLLQRTNHELAAARREAEEARQQREDFAVNISHELRTPLNIILGFTEIMHQSPEVYGQVHWPPTLRRDLTEIYRSARYLSDMVDDVLELARMEASLLPIRREPTDLATLIREAADIAAALWRGRPIEFIADLAPDLPSLFLDRTRIRQVLLNLLANASRYTEQGAIKVSAHVQDTDVLVSVADTGVGIPADQLDVIFNEFRQVDAWRQGEAQGKGLGLAIAKRFVQLHGGSIWAESEVGRGSTFHFTLPLERKDFSRLRAANKAPLPTNPFARTVIVLDEDELSTWHLQRHLEGYRVVHAANPEQLPAMCQEIHPDAVVVNSRNADSRLLDGCSAAVVRIECALPTAATLLQRGRFRTILNKPVSQAELVAALQQVVPTGDVLIVDDDRAFVQLVVRILAASGASYHASWAYSADEGLAKARRSSPDVILVDLVMPGKSGMAMAEALAADAELSRIPLIGVTGAAMMLAGKPGDSNRFVLERPRGLRDQAVIGLIKQSLELVRSDYSAELDSAPGPSATPSATPAS
ncbi:MAG: response regulator [Anaerolineae bacterium]|nr:response regulator [Anaerolineae bacterium]